MDLPGLLAELSFHDGRSGGAASDGALEHLVGPVERAVSMATGRLGRAVSVATHRLGRPVSMATDRLPGPVPGCTTVPAAG